MIVLRYLYAICKKTLRFLGKISWIITYFKLKLSGVTFFSDLRSNGIPILHINVKAICTIGRKFEMNNGRYNNMIGHQQPCFFIVDKDACLKIGDNVGISSTAIVCSELIQIGSGVRIGGGTVIYDTDFHSLSFSERISHPECKENIKKAPVIISDNVFIGAHSTILKGVEIGENSIIGACSVVTNPIPANEIWAGNPAKFIRKINV